LSLPDALPICDHAVLCRRGRRGPDPHAVAVGARPASLGRCDDSGGHREGLIDMELRDPICVVTGGGNGMGQALCRRFAAEGARAVVVVDKDADGALATAEALGSRGTALTADVTVEADVEAGGGGHEAGLGAM